MTWIVALSSKVYSTVLPLYPPDLNQNFGAEMTQVFTEDLDNAWENEGLTGAIRVWSAAGWEILRFALPVQAAKPAIAAPVISFALSVTAWSATMQHALRQMLETGALPLVEGFCGIVLWQSLVSAFIALVTVRVGRLSVPMSLGLGAAHRRLEHNVIQD
jgi:hypothetical protein